MIEEYCIEKDIINEVEETPTAETVDVLRLKLEFETEEQRLEREEAREKVQKSCNAEKVLQNTQLAAQLA